MLNSFNNSFILIGKITKPHGLHGEVFIKLTTPLKINKANKTSKPFKANQIQQETHKTSKAQNPDTLDKSNLTRTDKNNTCSQKVTLNNTYTETTSLANKLINEKIYIQQNLSNPLPHKKSSSYLKNIVQLSTLKKPTTEKQNKHLQKTDHQTQSNHLKAFKILKLREHKNGLILQLNTITSIELSEALKNTLVYLPKDFFVSPIGQNMFLCEVLNFDVYDQNRSSLLGKVNHFLSSKSQDLLVIKKEANTENQIIIPFIEALIVDIDFKNKKIFTKLPSNWPDLDI